MENESRPPAPAHGARRPSRLPTTRDAVAAVPAPTLASTVTTHARDIKWPLDAGD